jgi:hypothetical protein
MWMLSMQTREHSLSMNASMITSSLVCFMAFHHLTTAVTMPLLPVAWGWCAFIVIHTVATVLINVTAGSFVFAPFFEVAFDSNDSALVFVSSLAYVIAPRSPRGPRAGSSDPKKIDPTDGAPGGDSYTKNVYS